MPQRIKPKDLTGHFTGHVDEAGDVVLTIDEDGRYAAATLTQADAISLMLWLSQVTA